MSENHSTRLEEEENYRRQTNEQDELEISQSQVKEDFCECCNDFSFFGNNQCNCCRNQDNCLACKILSDPEQCCKCFKRDPTYYCPCCKANCAYLGDDCEKDGGGESCKCCSNQSACPDCKYYVRTDHFHKCCKCRFQCKD